MAAPQRGMTWDGTDGAPLKEKEGESIPPVKYPEGLLREVPNPIPNSCFLSLCSVTACCFNSPATLVHVPGSLEVLPWKADGGE